MDIEQLINKFTDMAVNYAPSVLKAIIALIVGFWVIGWITKLVRKMLVAREVDATLIPFLCSLVSIILKVALLLAVASMFGFETTSFIAILGAMAFAIGMALQGSLGHFASGVLLLIFRPYKVGDLVTVGGETGTVEELQVFNTVLRTLDNKKIIVPNSVVTNGTITNISGQGTIGVELTFGIGYEDDIDQAREAILRVGKNCPHILDDPAQGVVVAELGDSSVNLNTRPFCKSEHYWDTYFYMQEHVKKEFDKMGINIPYPTMDLKMPSKT